MIKKTGLRIDKVEGGLFGGSFSNRKPKPMFDIYDRSLTRVIGTFETRKEALEIKKEIEADRRNRKKRFGSEFIMR